MWKHLSYQEFEDFFGDLGLTTWVKFNWLAEVPDGYDKIDLGTLEWTKGTSHFSAPFISITGAPQPTISQTPKLLSTNAKLIPKSQGAVSGVAGTYEAYITQTGILTWYYPLDDFADGNAFKTAMSGNLLFFKKA